MLKTSLKKLEDIQEDNYQIQKQAYQTLNRVLDELWFSSYDYTVTTFAISPKDTLDYIKDVFYREFIIGSKNVFVSQKVEKHVNIE